MIDIKTWKELMIYLDMNLSSLSISVPMKGEYGETSLSFYEDGSVWAGNKRVSVKIFKKCPYTIMAAMFLQKHKEKILEDK